MSGYILSFVAWISRITPLTYKRALYKIRPLANLIRTSLNQFSNDELQVVSITSGGLKGKKFLLNLKTEKDLWLGTYEPDLISKLGEVVKSGMIVYDVGANIGYLTVFISSLIGENGRVYAFEALPENIERLESNLKLNNLQDRVKVIPQAVIDARKPVQFIRGPSGSTGKAEGSAGRDFANGDQSFQIQGTSLDEFIFVKGNPAPVVMKMDIEGGETLAFQGMQKMLLEVKPVIFLEIHGPQAGEMALNTFEKMGYQVHLLAEDHKIISSYQDLGWKAYVIARPE